MLLTNSVPFYNKEFSSEKELEEQVVHHANSVFGTNTIYINVKKKISSDKSSIATIPDGYLISFNDRKHPKLFIVEIELAEHDPLRHIGRQMLSFITSFNGSKREIQQILANQIKSDDEKLQKAELLLKQGGFSNLDEMLGRIVFEQDYGIIIVIDEQTDELNDVLNSLSKKAEVIEFKEYVDSKGNTIYSFEAFQQSILKEISAPGKVHSPVSLSDIDTIVCPAREEGFGRVFLGEKRWYSIRLNASIIPQLKHIAMYQVAPISAITHVGEIREIKPYQNSGKFEVILTGPPKQLENPIENKRDKTGKMQTFQAPRFTKYGLLQKAKQLTDAFP